MLDNNFGYYGRYGDATASQASADIAFQQYVYNTRLDYGLCDHDVTNVFNGYATYDLPFGKKRAYMHDANKFVNAVLGDWQINAVFTVHGGFPISMLDWGGDAGAGSAQGRPDCITPSPETPFKQWSGISVVRSDDHGQPCSGPLGQLPGQLRARARDQAGGHRPVEVLPEHGAAEPGV